MGLGFLAPTRRLDGADLSEQLPSPSDEAGTSLMWQAPNSDAMLFFGERWSELHWYVSQVVERQQQQGAGQSELLSRKQVSKRHPAWLEHVLSLSRLRGYRTVYPGKETAAVVLASHNDVPDVPDEYGDDAEAARDAVVSQGDARSDPAAAVDDDAAYTFSAHWQVDMLRTLPRGGGLPPVEELPLLAWDGRSVHPDDVDDEAKALRARFRTEVGGCATAGDDKEPDVKKASDLFCPVG